MTKIRFKDYLIDYLEYNNINNKDFANRIGITPKHLIDILSGKRDLSSSIIENISLITSIPIDYIFKTELNYKMEEKITSYLKKENITLTNYLNKFNYKYLIQTKYIDFIDQEDKVEVIKDILKFLRVTTPEKIHELEKEGFYKSKNNKPELLLLWLEKCYRQTLNQIVSGYKKENIDTLIKYISDCALNNIFNESELIKVFNKYGIFLVIHDDIPGSKIRGVFKVHKNSPAIYLTCKHRCIADIYFALLHELAHCKSDFNKAKSESLISYETNNDDLEVKADNMAFNWMVPNDYYFKVCLSQNYNIDNEDKYAKSFIVYRLAKDGYIKYNNSLYQKYNNLLSI